MKSLPAFVVGMALGAVATAAFISISSKPVLLELKKVQVIHDWQTAEIGQQRREIALQNNTIHRLRAVQAQAAPSPAATPTPAKPQNPLAGLASLMNNPAMRKMMASQQKKIIEDHYADLIDQLHLTPEERVEFLELLSAKQMISTDFGMKMLRATPEERRSMGEQMQAANEDAEEGIRNFLNSDADFAIYKSYKGEQAQRLQLQSLHPGLDRIRQPLSADQTKSLIELMRSERLASPRPLADTDDPTLSPDDSARMIEAHEERQQRIIARAAAVLTPEQLEVFRQNQASELEMLKLGAEISRTMFGDDLKPAR